MDLGFFHASLPILIVKKLKHRIKRLLPVIQDVGKGPSLPVLHEYVPRDRDFRHT
jgi:hypothetical protein